MGAALKWWEERRALQLMFVFKSGHRDVWTDKSRAGLMDGRRGKVIKRWAGISVLGFILAAYEMDGLMDEEEMRDGTNCL